MPSSQASVVVGLAMIVAGVGLWGVGAVAQTQRAQAAAAVAQASAAAACPVCPACKACPACPPCAAPPAAGGAASASASVSASASAPASASASAPAASGAAAPSGDASFFKIATGQLGFARDEQTRLIALARDLQKQPGKIVIEGHGDDETPQGAALGKRRGLIARQLLIEVGLDGERLLLVTPAAGAGQGGGVSVRLQEKSP